MTTPQDIAQFEALSTEAASVHVQPSAWARVRKSTSVRIGGFALALLVVIALLAPWLGTVDPSLFDPASRDLLPGKMGEITMLEGQTLAHKFLMGSDSFGRDIYSRVIYGTQVSLIVGVATAVVALAFGILLGLCSGFLRWLDGPLMRVMDGVMAIPAILIAIALVAMWRGSLLTVVVAIAIPEIPRVTRLVRSLVLSIREEPYVEAAISLGTPTWLIMLRHILPNCVAPLVVQGTFICASGILTEAILSFLGVGLPPDIPTWGNVMAEGRSQFNEYPHNIFFPGIFLAITVLAVNILGDGLRDTLDPEDGQESVTVVNRPKLNLAALLTLLALLLTQASCGGGSSAERSAAPSAARPSEAPQAISVRIPDATALFDWAQQAYAQFFPGSFASGVEAGYSYRYYASSGNYIGVAGDAVAVFGPLSGGNLLGLGRLADFACSIYPADCATASAPRLGAGPGYTMAVRADGSVLTLGSSATAFINRAPGTTIEGSSSRLLTGFDAAGIVAGAYSALVVSKDGQLTGWGLSTIGSLGEFNTNVLTPKLLAGPGSNVEAATTTDNYTLAKRSDGTVWHLPGVITFGKSNPVVTPSQVSELAGVRKIVSGMSQGPLAIKEDGSVWLLSWNVVSTVESTGPVQTHIGSARRLPGLVNVVDVACSRQHCLALSASGQLSAWGRNVEGQLGNGSSGDAAIVETPVDVTGLSDVRSIAAAGVASVAVTGDGHVWTWGATQHGQGETGTLVTATQIMSLSDVVEAAATEGHCVVRLRDGTLWSWGSNASGQFGDGGKVSRNVPVQATGISLN